MTRHNLRLFIIAILLSSLLSVTASADQLLQSIQADYKQRLGDLFIDFHRNPELSTAEVRTAKKLAAELRSNGFEVSEGIGGTGILALMENGPGPLVMLRADMDGLPLKEKSGLPYASTATQLDPITGKVFPVMHACGHDVHITSLAGTAKQMAERRDN